jgi:hypothetical protein
MANPIRFWGTVAAVKPRIVLTKFGEDTAAKCHGHLLVLDGTFGPDGNPPNAGRFTVALGPATQTQRGLAPGDLLRGDAHPVPEGVPDTPADLYRVGALRVVARQGDPGTPPRPVPDPPRTDLPLTPEAAESAPRRALAPDNLLAEDGVCVPCPYGALVPVVRLSDPRDYRNGRWSRVPACLGPMDCPYYAAAAPTS